MRFGQTNVCRYRRRRPAPDRYTAVANRSELLYDTLTEIFQDWLYFKCPETQAVLFDAESTILVRKLETYGNPKATAAVAPACSKLTSKIVPIVHRAPVRRISLGSHDNIQ